MQKRINQTGILMALALLQAGCGGGGDNNSVAANMGNELEGTWRQSCQFNAEDSDYEQGELVVSGTEFTLTQRTFIDDGCSDKEQETQLRGTYSTGSEVPVVDGGVARELDLNLTGVTLAVFTENVVGSANASALCGISSWEAGTSVDVSNCSDIAGTETPRLIYDIYRISGNQLITGDEEGATPEARPTSLNTESAYLRDTSDNQGTDNEDPEPPEDGPDGTPVLPEGSLSLTAENGLAVAQFAISQYDLIKGLTNAGNTGVLSLAGNTSGRITGLYLTSSCEGGGAASINGTPAMLKKLTVRYSDCLIDGALYNGNLMLNFILVNGDLGDTSTDWSFSAMANMDGLNVSSANRSVDLEGDFVLTTVFVADTEIAGGATSRFQGIQNEVIFMRETTDISRMIDFDFLFTYRSESPAPYTDAIDEARISSSVIGGQISLAQSSGFSGYDLELPSHGELEVFGANGSMLEIDAEESDSVIISVDADGNGSFTDAVDSVTSGSWSGYFVR